MNKDKDVENILITKEVKPTAVRLLVLQYLLTQQSAVSLGELEEELYNADKVTLYRTLKTFEDKGIVHAITDRSAVTKYALCEDTCSTTLHDDMHVHFYCTNCKELYCLPKIKIPEVILPAKFDTHEMSLIVRGLCDQCHQK